MPHHVTKKYAKEGVTVLWQSALCTHSAKCIRGLPEVFDVNRSPWIDVEGASVEEIKAQVAKCPSGALSIVAE
jgi:putative redox protein